ncbi:hypothetical protein CIB48_g6595 [Xylaria polymorpha]|nr:hypothetical protein CIB48_g6595 [Xylaria polymorpha]
MLVAVQVLGILHDPDEECDAAGSSCMLSTAAPGWWYSTPQAHEYAYASNLRFLWPLHHISHGHGTESQAQKVFPRSRKGDLPSAIQASAGFLGTHSHSSVEENKPWDLCSIVVTQVIFRDYSKEV